jgi:uncharacterized membrane protein
VTLAPLLDASIVIRIHAFAALAALVLGAVQLAAGKGNRRHRLFGWIWVTLMLVVALSSFWIHGSKGDGGWSPIHILAIVTLVALPSAVLHARRHRVAAHRGAMIWLYVGALVIAGAFTLLPGRIMHDVVFGQPSQPS